MINEPLETRPIDKTASIWKNRFLVQSKLTASNHRIFLAYCKKNNFNFSSGINNLISTYLSTNKDV
tara:strand:- start:996 stop:1193 length:198 start_codon:yes stop_codon:yes gene_type:complete